MNTPDIEIYAKDINSDIIIDLLTQQFEASSLNIDPKTLGIALNSTACITIQLPYKEHSIELIITPRAAGKSFCSFWFKSENTPWENDEACALTLLEENDIEIRCAASGWQEDEEKLSEQWLLLTQNEKKLIHWG